MHYPECRTRFILSVLKHGKLFNKKDCVRMDDSRVHQFNIGDITIQENKDCNDVAETIDTLNSELDPTAEKYIYHGQSIHRLAKGYYDRNFDSEFLSQMSPQVADIFNDRLSKNTSFNLTFENTHAEYAVDFNKHFAQILRCCDGMNMFGWCQ